MVKTTNTSIDFHCLLTNGAISTDCDAPVSKGGLGNGFRPHELLEAALATCINISIRMIAKQKNIRLDKVETQVEIEKTVDSTIFKYKINLDENLNDQQKNILLNVIDSCAVKQTLSKQLLFVDVNSSFKTDI
jgi:putative redox protein